VKYIIATLIIILSVHIGFAQETYQDNFYTIEEFNRRNFLYGTYYTAGFVVHLYDCNACKKDATCPPCSQDYIVISADNPILARHDPSEKELIIFVDDANVFKRGEKYLFLVQVLDVKTIEQIANNLKLIYYKKDAKVHLR